jgi:hypothetical protein
MNVVYKEAICGSCELLFGVDEEVLRKIVKHLLVLSIRESRFKLAGC